MLFCIDLKYYVKEIFSTILMFNEIMSVLRLIWICSGSLPIIQYKYNWYTYNFPRCDNRYYRPYNISIKIFFLIITNILLKKKYVHITSSSTGI